MAITVICSCQARYVLRDEFLGKLIECPKCHAKMYAIEQRQVSTVTEQVRAQDPGFNHDKFLLRQKHWAISEKYYVWDDKGNKLLYVERPAYYFLHFLAIICGIIGGIIVAIILGSLVANVKSPVLGVVLWIFVILAALFTIFTITIILYKKSHVYFYRDDSRKELVLKVLQENKIQVFNAYYTIVDAQDNVLAKLKKNYLYNIFRRRWYGYNPDGTLLCIAREDSLILSLLRRLLGNFFGLLRMNFEIIDKDGNNLGEFNRKLTILDRYVLDMSHDLNRKLDRRIVLGLGVMLDTGEKR